MHFDLRLAPLVPPRGRVLIGRPDASRRASPSRDPAGLVMCDLSDGYRNNGYSRWPFFEYMAEKYGTPFVNDIFAQGAAGAPNATTALANALVARGTTLADAYDEWTAVDLASLYTVPALQGRTPVRYGGALDILSAV